MDEVTSYLFLAMLDIVAKLSVEDPPKDFSALYNRLLNTAENLDTINIYDAHAFRCLAELVHTYRDAH